MRIPLDRNDPAPLYRQIENYFRGGILAGSLPLGARLPSSRELARDLGVNRMTVETAYAGLEAEGLIVARQGSGAYVSVPFSAPSQPAPGPTILWPNWQPDPQAWARLPGAAAPADLLCLAHHPNPIDLSDGMGDPQQFPAEEFRKVMQQVMRQDGLAALDYGDRRGFAPLRGTISQVVASQGLAVSPENFLITSGSQQALALVCQVLLQPGDAVLVEAPTYSGALDLFHRCSARVFSIPTDEQGMQTETLETLLKQYSPRLIYAIPNFQNPSGACLNGARRRQLIALADHYAVPIVEDDFVGDLRYEGRAQPALKALDPGGRVIYVSTFSKMLMPGLRVGFLAAHGPIYDLLAEAKRVTDLATASLMQRALEAYVTIGRYQAFLRRSCQRYRRRREAMVNAIGRYLPPEVHFSTPQGGLFIWLRLPEGVSSEALLPLACQQGMAFMPGTRFFAQPGEGEPYIRLNFACQPPERIEEAIQRLGRAVCSVGR